MNKFKFHNTVGLNDLSLNFKLAQTLVQTSERIVYGSHWIH